ncbi:MAG: hypothetical protein ABS26_11890 [OM182 bacterium BACL3 MAG-120531-bin86]|uniref:tRNA(Ile)-lysidine synthase n=1 Tax=OM182 bacterium BACL3 MAG-120531-bin86 TaxID=1655628 RepID=A0A0R2XZJ3_9GAMM|nr:MAG: hypothetical protein ABS26_11890 [OM182 bacterium BACL3 MAG-120531-bin86]
MASAPSAPSSAASSDVAAVKAEATLLAALRRAFCFEPRLLAASAPATTLPASLSTSVLASLADASRLLNPTSIMVGLSGGLDSSLLLTLLCDLRARGELTLPLRAIHINHGLQEAADKWQLHCETLCAQHGVNLTVCVVDCSLNSAGATAERKVGESAVVSEEAARRARYAAFEGALDTGEWLALGHHQDDQLETLLLRLARGSGVDGLAGMPSARVLGAGALIRPWLEIPRQSLEDVARTRRLSYVEDPSNQNTHYDRNLLRAEVLPLIESRWPRYRQSWGKSQQLVRESCELNADLAEIDLKVCLAAGASRLCVAEMALLSSPRRRNLLRHWLISLGCSAPSWKLLNRLDSETCVHTDQSAQWQCGAYSLYRFKGELIAVREDDFEPQVMSKQHAPSADEVRIELPGNGILILLSGSETIVSDSHFSVRYRQGGERLSLPGRPSKSLKKTLNEESVAPWLRDRLPLVFIGNELLWVALLGPTAEAAKYTEVNASGQGLGVTFEWLSPALELSREANSRL